MTTGGDRADRSALDPVAGARAVSPETELNQEFTRWHRPASWELASVAAILCVFTVLGLILILDRPPLGHDEAVYALRARFLAGEHPSAGYWANYRAPGLPMLMRLAWPLGDTDGHLRLVVLVIAAGGIVVTWVWARRWFGARAGLVAAALLATMPWYLGTAYRVFVDAPGTTFGVAAVAAFALSITPAGLSRWALLTVPLAGLATLTRYGAPTLIAGGLGVVALAHWRELLGAWRRAAAVACATAVVVGAILLVPAVTGSKGAPLSAFRARQDAKGIGAFESYGDFNEYWGEVLGGLDGLLVVVGIALLLVALLRSPRGARRRLAVVPLVFCASYVLLNAGLAQGFPQYLVPMLPFVAMAAASGLATVLDRVKVPVVIALLAAVMSLGGWLSFDRAREMSEEQSRRFSSLVSVSREIGDLPDGDCLVITSYSPQVAWYSGCPAVPFPPNMREGAVLTDVIRERLWSWFDGRRDPQTRVYWMLMGGGKRQPEGVDLAGLHEMTREIVIEVEASGGGAQRDFEVGYLGTYGELATGPG